MAYICTDCGLLTSDEVIDPRGPFVVCPACGHGQPFVRPPIFAVTGPSGAGKTTVALRLPPLLPECVTLDTDVLWGHLPATPDDNFRGYHDTWLAVASAISQNGRPVVLCGAITPAQWEATEHRRYFAAAHYLALVCDDELLAERLSARPAWRNAGSPEFIAKMQRFNRWLKAHAATTAPPIDLFDTSRRPVEETLAHVAAWVRARLP